MRPLLFPIALTTFVLIVYVIFSRHITFFPLIFSLFVLLNILLVWMVIHILKKGTPSDATFDEQWYEDQRPAQ